MALTQSEIQDLRDKFKINVSSSSENAPVSARINRLRAIAEQSTAGSSSASEQQGEGQTPNLSNAPFRTLARSGSEFIGGALSSLRHPIRTLKGLGQGFIGAEQNLLAKGIESITGKKTVKTESQQVADAIGSFYNKRYGGIENAKKTFLEDPVGFLADASIILGGVGGLVGKVGSVSKISDIARAGANISRVGELVDPIGLASKSAGLTSKVLKPITKKIPKPSIAGIGEVLTGVDKNVISRYAENFAKNPEKIKELHQIVSTSEKEPINPLVQSVANKLNNLREKAQNTYREAVDTIRSRTDRVRINEKFDIKETLPQINKTLKKHGLEVRQARRGGKFIDKIDLKSTSRTNPFTSSEMKDVSRITDTLRIEDATAAELLDWDILTKGLFEKYSKADNKKMIALLSGLTEDASQFVDSVLPEINNANSLYRNYYDALSKGGNKIISSSGDVKPGAESFISNSININKGVIRKNLQSLSEKLGVDIVGDVQKIRDIQKLTQSVPHTVRNRTMDVMRGIFGISVVLGGGVATRAASAFLFLATQLATKPETLMKFIQWTTKPKKSPLPTELLSEIRTVLGEPGVTSLLSVLGRNNLIDTQGDINQ